MKKSIVWALGLVVAASLTVSKPCNAAFVIGGENGWQISTDGIVDVFATYNTTSPHPGGSHALSLLDNTGSDYNQRFGVDVGLLPSVVAFNIKAPTTNGIDSTVRIGIYLVLEIRGMQVLLALQVFHPPTAFQSVQTSTSVKCSTQQRGLRRTAGRPRSELVPGQEYSERHDTPYRWHRWPARTHRHPWAYRLRVSVYRLWPTIPLHHTRYGRRQGRPCGR